MQRNVAAAPADQEAYLPELISEEEPKFLRRQKPVEIRRKKIGGKAWPFYRRFFFWSLVGVSLLAVTVAGSRFALHSPQMLLLRPDQIDVTGNRIVPREEIQRLFLRDRNKSILQIPLDRRRSEVQEVSWVEDASIQRILPDHLRVEITERTPIAFFRNAAELTLIDAHGVLLDRPEGEDYHFPIVTGLSENMPRDEREKRMKTYQEFMKAIDMIRTGSTDRVSELDLGSPRDLRVVMTGLASANDSQAVTVHFGQNDFINKYRKLIENFAQWQASAGRVQSIDLQYSRQVVVNPDTSALAPKHK